MPVQYLPPARQTRSQAIGQAFLTPTPRDPLDRTPAALQLRACLDRGPKLEGGKRAKKIKLIFRSSTGWPPLAQFNQPFSHQSEPSLLAIMQHITQIMANIQEASSSEDSRPPSMKAPECFDGTQPYKVRSFLQSFQLIFQNDQAYFSEDRKKFLYSTLFLIGRAAKLIEPPLSNLTNQDRNYLLSLWALFESQLFTLFGDPNKVRKAEEELDSLIMKEGGHVSLYIADFRSLVSRTGDYSGRALVHHFRTEFPSRILDQLAYHPSRNYSLQDSMEIPLELDTRYHQRKKEKSHFQEKKPESQSQFLLILKIIQFQIKRRRRIFIFRRGTSPNLLC
ncbi:hypothetical protein O181_026322 [Austropuccinia psidii MF-1]|uniref:Retrotransposon gag domain-containing protein n=1 Tax=Austropuccinia psidii MF-1 TaxID=1389203 RepID=A0A9Q3CMV3_9BASI|nr:hypothetical protein [Austropuccinia psidii MF-1]